MNRTKAREIIKICHRDINNLTEEYDQVTRKLQVLQKQLAMLTEDIKKIKNKKCEIYGQLVELQKTQIETICFLENAIGEEE